MKKMMKMNELQSKRVFKDPLFLYDQFKKAYNKSYFNKELDIEKNSLAAKFLENDLFKKLFCDEKENALKILNEFFKDFSKLIFHVDNYCRERGLEWDIYLNFKTTYSGLFELNFNFLIKLSDFDLFGGRNNKVWSYKDPYLTFYVKFLNNGFYNPRSISLFFGKTHILAFMEEFNHPHIKNNLVKNLIEEDSEKDFGQLLNESIKEGSFCYGSSNIYSELNKITKNQEEFNYLMFRLTNYIKEYNSSDCYKIVPKEVEHTPYIKSIVPLVELPPIISILSIIKNAGFSLSPKYFFLEDDQLEIVDYFYEDLKNHYLNNTSKYEVKMVKFMRENLTTGEYTLTELLTLENEKDSYKLLLEEHTEDTMPSFIFNGKEVKLELYDEKQEITFEWEELHFTKECKNYLKNLIIKDINERKY